MLRAWVHRLLSIFRRGRLDADMDEEIRVHLEMATEEYVGRGMSLEDAERAARTAFGGVDQVRERHRETRGVPWLEDLVRDFRLATRTLRRDRAFAITIVITLAVAIGATTAVFSVIQAVLLQPLPYAQPDRLVAVWSRFLPSSGYDIPRGTLSSREVLNLQEETKALASMGVIRSGASSTLTGDNRDAEQVSVWLADASLLPALGVEPALGRWFTREEDQPDGGAVMVLTHPLWVSRYGADPEIIGRSITMSGVSTRVVGVLPAGFSLWLGDNGGVYMPLRLTPETRTGHLFGVIARLAPSTTMADVDAELDVLNKRWADADPPQLDEVWAAPLKADRLGNAPDVLYVMVMAVGLVLLVACANVANLLLARGERRRSELCVRTALGAGRGRLVRQLVTESLTLAVLASFLTLPIAWMGTEALIALDPSALPRLGEVHMDAVTLVFTMSVALATTFLFGLAPAVVAGKAAAWSTIRSSPRTAAGRTSGRLRRALVTAEVAVSLVVVILAGLLLRSFRARVSTDPGFRAADVLAFDLTLPPRSYPQPDLVSVEYQRLLESFRAIPGVESVSGGSAVPFGRHMLRFDFWLEDHAPHRRDEPAWDAVTNWVMPGYFKTLGIPILEGRASTRADDANAPYVAVINETMARAFWPGESPVGKAWHYGAQSDVSAPRVTVIGVVPDQLRSRVDEVPLPQVYLSALQGGAQRDLTVLIRAAEPLSHTPALQAAVSAFDSDLPISNVRAMQDALASSMAGPQLATALLATFALLALVLATLGLYGVVSYSVAGRTKEIGLRVALGADAARVIRLVTGEGAQPAVAGILLGLGGAWLASRLVRSMLYGVAPTDTLTFTIVPLGLLAVASAASLVPALRATRIPPTDALRED